MMKRLFLSLSLVASVAATTVFAVPAQRGLWKTVTLADGTQVKVELRGDEWGHYWQAADGTAYQEMAGKAVFQKIDKESVITKANVLRSKAGEALRAPSRVTLGGTHQPYEGAKKGLIILVDFPETKFQSGNDVAFYNKITSQKDLKEGRFVGSVRDYFFAQSQGRFDLTFDVVGPYTAKHAEAYYAGSGGTENVASLMAEAVQAVDSLVDYAKYDWDDDGIVDQVYMIYAGEGRATGGPSGTIWPHAYTIAQYGLNLDGKRFKSYACSNEWIDNGLSGGRVAGIGTICHEFSHCLGLPDMYDTQYGGNYGMNTWDIMDQGPYNGDQFIPAGYTAYDLMYVGWKQPKVLENDTIVSSMKAINDGGDTYIMYNDGHKDEYYLLENRQQTGWDAGIPGKGLLVTHVDYNASIWAGNMVNTTGWGNNHQRCTPIHANNSTRNPAGDTYPYGTNNMLMNTTTPGATLYNNNTDGTKYMNKSLLNIALNNDRTIAFEFRNGSTSQQPNRPEGAIFYESFDYCSGKGGNDDVWYGNSIGQAQFVPDVVGWSTGTIKGADKCILTGSASIGGNIATPMFQIEGKAVLKFKVAPFQGANSPLMVVKNVGSVTINGKAAGDTLQLEEGKWNEISIQLEGKGTTSVRFKSRKRFFLDEVTVLSSDVTGINGVETVKPEVADKRIFGLDGTYMGTDLNALPKGIYIVGGRKVVK